MRQIDDTVIFLQITGMKHLSCMQLLVVFCYELSYQNAVSKKAI